MTGAGALPTLAAMARFVVRMAHGPNWDAAKAGLRGIREQDAWAEHAAFMDRLVDEGFVIIGGPLGDGEEALQVVEAQDEAEVRARLAADPWNAMGLLQVGEIRCWTIWLDVREVTAQPSATS
jgi:uncharacterized protein YciI